MSQASTYSIVSDSPRTFDPLVALHDRRLEENPEWEISVLSDDEMIDLLKSTKDPKELSYLNMELSKQTLPGNQGSILSFESRSSGTESQHPSIFDLSRSSE